jgi:hypothetical protein
VRASFPPSARSPGPGGLALRIPHPFGAGHAIEQLLLELHPGAAPSPCVARVTRAPAPAGLGRLRMPWPVVALAIVAAVLFALLGR